TVDGMITSWSYRSGIGGGQLALRVLHPSGSGFTGAGTSPTVATPNDGSDSVRGPFAVSIPVHAGDRVGLRDVNGTGVPVYVSGSSSDSLGYFAPDIADGATAQPTSAGTGPQVLVQATIEGKATRSTSTVVACAPPTAQVGTSVTCRTT